MKHSQTFLCPSFACFKLGVEEGNYPSRLRQLARPPKMLWYRGCLPLAGGPIVAVVGARAASRAACDIAYSVSKGLGSGGIAIASGGAFGVDAAAHEGGILPLFAFKL